MLFSLPPVLSALLAAAFGLMLALLLLGRVPLSYNLRNLTVRWRTTLITALAFTLSIALLTVMLAFVNGMDRLTENSGRADNVLVMTDRAPDEVMSNLDVGDLAEIEHQPQVRRVSGRPMASRETYLVVNQFIPGGVAGLQGRRFLQLRGIDDPQMAATVHDLQLRPGSERFSAAGVREASGAEDRPGATTVIECVMGEGAARELGHERSSDEAAQSGKASPLVVGDTFTLGKRTWLVVGILDSSGSMFNSEVWAKRSLVAEIFGKNTYTTLVLRADSPERARELKESLVRYKKAAVAPQLETEY